MQKAMNNKMKITLNPAMSVFIGIAVLFSKLAFLCFQFTSWPTSPLCLGSFQRSLFSWFQELCVPAFLRIPGSPFFFPLNVLVSPVRNNFERWTVPVKLPGNTLPSLVLWVSPTRRRPKWLWGCFLSNLRLITWDPPRALVPCTYTESVKTSPSWKAGGEANALCSLRAGLYSSGFKLSSHLFVAQFSQKWGNLDVSCEQKLLQQIQTWKAFSPGRTLPGLFPSCSTCHVGYERNYLSVRKIDALLFLALA